MQAIPEISIVAPAYEEADSVELFHAELKPVLDELALSYEIIYINDGSTDATLEKLLALQKTDDHVVVINLSRNFGKEIALTAGLDHAKGKCVIPIDVDLQDPPSLIPKLVEKWQEGFQVVNARRRTRTGESVAKKVTAHFFYKLMRQLGDKNPLPDRVGDFRLIDRAALEAVNAMREQHRFMKGIFALVGYRTAYVDYDRNPRHKGRTKFNYWRLWNLSLEGITSYTTFPLRLFSYFGLFVSIFAFAYGSFIFIKTALFGDEVAGFTTIFVAVAFLGGVQLIGLGVIGEYLGRIFNETKNRPLYFTNGIYRTPPPSLEATQQGASDKT